MALQGIRVLELAGLAPSPYCGLILAQHGADVIRVDRDKNTPRDPSGGSIGRGKRSIAVNLKTKQGVETIIKMAKNSDVIIEPYRPGVMEKLGLGPDVLLAANPRLIYARLTGWGQTGAFNMAAGHDINYIGFTGALDMLRRNEEGSKPHAPINILGDFAGGGMLCALGILLALVERNKSGKGQVIDSAMVDGVTHLNTFAILMRAAGVWNDQPGTNVLDTGAPFYDTYMCKDGKFMALGAIEPPFYKLALKGLGLDQDKSIPKQMDMKRWGELKARLATVFLTKTRDEWTAIFSGPLKDACCTPVLSMAEVPSSQHMKDRGILIQGPGGAKDVIPAPAPRLSRSKSVPSPMGKGAVARDGQHSREILNDFGFAKGEIDGLIQDGHVVQYVGKSKL